jgi:hypothetical protein
VVCLNLNINRFKCISDMLPDRVQAVYEIRYSQELRSLKPSRNAKTLSRSSDDFFLWPACEFFFDCTYNCSNLFYLFGSEGVKQSKVRRGKNLVHARIRCVNRVAIKNEMRILVI